MTELESIHELLVVERGCAALGLLDDESPVVRNQQVYDLAGETSATSMCATFTDDDVGKPVERADGTVIGTVASLESDGAYVEPAPDAIDRLLIRFDRAEPDEPFVLDADDVLQVSETRVHLAEEFTRTPASEAPDETTADPDDGDDAGDAATESRSDGGAATAATEADDGIAVGPFAGRFQVGAAVVAGISFLLALVVGWFGFVGQPLVGVELDVVTGAVGLLLLGLVGVVSLVAAIYMKPGFDH